MGKEITIKTEAELADAILAINEAPANGQITTLVVNPGRYQLNQIKDLTLNGALVIRGTGNTARETHLDLRILVKPGGQLALTNLAMENLQPGHATVYMAKNTELALTDVYLLNHDGQCPTVMLERVQGKFEHTILANTGKNGDGLGAVQSANCTITDSVIQGLTAKNNVTLNLNAVAFMRPVAIDNQCKLTGMSVYLASVDELAPALYLGNQCQVNLHFLGASPDIQTIRNVNSKITARTANVDAGHYIIATSDNLYAVSIKDAMILGTHYGDPDIENEDLPDKKVMRPEEKHLFQLIKTARQVDPQILKDGLFTQEWAKIEEEVEGTKPKKTNSVTAEVNENDSESRVNQANLSDNVATSEKPVKATPAVKVNAMAQLDAMIGLTTLKATVKKFVNMALYNQQREAQGLPVIETSYHALFLGNPGTGKTTVARLLGKIMYEQHILSKKVFVEASRQDLVGEYVGMTAPKTTKLLESALGGVLFIDEAYSLATGGKDGNDFGQEAIDTMLKFMEDHRNELMIILAGYTAPMQDLLAMNEGLASRIPNVFNFEDYSAAEISQIGSQQLLAQKFEFDQTFYQTTVAKAYQHAFDHSNGRWIRNLNEQLLQIVAQNYMADSTARTISTITNADINELMGGDQPDKDATVAALVEQVDHLIGLPDIKMFVHDFVDRQALQQRLAGQLPDEDGSSRHMLFTGNPGTGKTTVARLIGQLFYNLDLLPKATVTEVSRADLVGSYVGQTEQKTQQVLTEAMGGVLFVDEAYELNSSGEANDYGARAIDTLMTAMENHRNELVVIFAGYGQPMTEFLATNPGLHSRIPYTLNFADYQPNEVAEIVAQQVLAHWQCDAAHLRQAVATQYAQVPAADRSNGRWARNYAERLVERHKKWLTQHPEVTAVTQISNDLIDTVQL